MQIVQYWTRGHPRSCSEARLPAHASLLAALQMIVFEGDHVVLLPFTKLEENAGSLSRP